MARRSLAEEIAGVVIGRADVSKVHTENAGPYKGKQKVRIMTGEPKRIRIRVCEPGSSRKDVCIVTSDVPTVAGAVESWAKGRDVEVELRA